MNRLPSTDLDHILEHTRELWDALRGERVFITGGTGLFGKWLLESLLWANDRLKLECRCTILTHRPDNFKANTPHLAGDDAVSLLYGDVRNFAFPVGEFSHIVHAATYMQPYSKPVDATRMFQENIQGTAHVLEFSNVCKAKRFLFTSSGAVYGKQPPEITHLAEDYQGAPDTTDIQTAYGQSKRASEFLCAAMAGSTLQVKIARCFAFVGPYLPLDINFAIGNFIQDALNGNPIAVKGDGTPQRSYLYTADLAIWLWTILFQGLPLRPYNVGGEESLSIRELAEHVAACVDPAVRVEILSTPKTNIPIERYVPSTARARNELGLRDCFALDAQIKNTINYYRNNIE